MSAGRIVLLVFGILFVIVSFGLIIGGGVVLAIDSALRDDQGFYATDFVPVAAPNSSAVITRSADIRLEPWWFMRHSRPVTIQIEASNNLPDRQIFIGIARETDLRAYLEDASYAEITGFSLYPYNIDFSYRTGTAEPPPPTDQDFWIASASGPDTQLLRWDVVTGTYSLVLMNADGSSPIDASVSLGVRIPQVLRNTGLGLLIGGIVLLAAGGVMIFFAARGW